MISSQEVLERAAKDGSIQTDDWPRVLEDILARLESAIRGFPTVTVPAPEPPPPRPPPILASPLKPEEPSSQDSHITDKENAPPATPSPRPPVPAFPQRTSQSDDTSTLAHPNAPGNDTVSNLPIELRPLYTSICTSLTKNFPKQAPHTIQRLAELILQPKQHYRFLPPYLRALDRVVCVSSPVSVFPLPQAAIPSGGLLNGTTNSAAASLGSDESLGGALLTPIPWLRPEHERMAAAGPQSQSELKSESTELIDGPNGAGRIETVTVVNGVMTSATSNTAASSSSNTSNTSSAASSTSPTATHDHLEESLRAEGAVTQGELLRQEQEAGVVPVGQPSPRRPLSSGNPTMAGTAEGAPEAGRNEADEPPEEYPHARGPGEIGMEDMGPQERALGGSLDMEAAVGRSAVRPEEQGQRGAEEGGKGDGDQMETTMGGRVDSAEAQGDTEMTDADADGEVEAEIGMVGGEGK